MGRIGILAASLALALAGLPQLARAQSANLGGMTLPGMGPLMSPGSSMAGAGGGSQAKGSDIGLSITESYVAFIDSALPRSNVGLRFDGNYYNNQPMRAEYLFRRGGIPGSTGFQLPETRVDSQELTSFAEYSLTPWFSFFVEAPYRFINPEINGNESGPGDMRYGMRICTWSSDSVIATFLVRLYQPSARSEQLGTGHWSIEPGILASYQFKNFHFEGELRYWLPLGGSDFAGEVLRYGVGISYGPLRAKGIWYTPVVEAVGWTVTSGRTMVASSADTFVIEEAHGQTIVNAYLGMRFGYGKNLDFYAGYGRTVTQQFWARDNFRFELRFSY